MQWMERKKNTEQTRLEAQKYVINNLRWKWENYTYEALLFFAR